MPAKQLKCKRCENCFRWNSQSGKKTLQLAETISTLVIDNSDGQTALTWPTHSTLKYFPLRSNSSSFCRRRTGGISASHIQTGYDGQQETNLLPYLTEIFWQEVCHKSNVFLSNLGKGKKQFKKLDRRRDWLRTTNHDWPATSSASMIICFLSNTQYASNFESRITETVWDSPCWVLGGHGHQTSVASL